MRALTLTQPFASLVVGGMKTYETRSWQTPYRGRLAIHAAKGLAGMTNPDLLNLCKTEPFRTALVSLGIVRTAQLPRGAVLGTVELVSIIHTETAREYAPFLSPTELAFGDYSDGRYAWELTNVLLFETPIPARGMLGLWNWEEPSL